MPFHITPVSRRQFITGGLTAGAVFGLGLTDGVADELQARDANGSRAADRNAWALLSDTHIWKKRDVKHRDVFMAKNLEQVCAEILALEKRPGNLLINGDCAFKDGQAADYALFSDLTAPLTKAGIPLHLTLGNHDHRERFWNALKNGPGQEKRVENKHVSFVAGEKANWFLLDSLDKTDVAPGLLGEKQIQWLAAALDANPNKPAIVASHHHPDGGVIKSNGIVDTQALYDVLVPRKQVKALFFGHTHHWNVKRHEGLHLVNLPPVAYIFNNKDPIGWVKFQIGDDGGTIEFVALDRNHPAHAQKHELKWRT